MVHAGFQTSQGEPVAEPETLLLIIRILARKYDIKEALCILSNPLLKIMWTETP